jgi:malate dehydrogenase (oxaloacetate-decarboxylating)(NADP+)
LDPRLISVVAPAVAKAAIESGVARRTITDWDEYKINLAKRLGLDNRLTQDIRNKAKTNPKRVVFADAHNYMVLKAVEKCVSEGIAKPILLGRRSIIDQIVKENNLNIGDVPVIEYLANEELDRRMRYASMLFEKRQRKGTTLDEAMQSTLSRETFGLLMVESGDADAFISGFSAKYSDIVRPALQIVGRSKDQEHIAGMFIVNTKKGPYFFADTTVNRDLTPQTLVDICLLTAKQVRKFGIEPHIAIVSFSNFGDVREGSPSRVHQAVEILHKNHPDLIVDGEMQVDFAFNKELRMKKFPFTKLGDKEVNTIIFPNLSSGNIAYKMMNAIGGAEIIGPVLLGMGKPVQILQMESSVSEIINLAAIAVVDAQDNEE